MDDVIAYRMNEKVWNKRRVVVLMLQHRQQVNRVHRINLRYGYLMSVDMSLEEMN